MVDLNDMLVFARVVRDASFSAAANSLGVPRSNVSRRVARLERDLGARLLERTTRRLHLTEAGELYYPHCRRIEEEAENAEISVQELLETPRGLLRVTASVTTGQQLIAPHLAEFISLYPDVKLDLELTNRRVDLIEEGFDVALRVGKLEPSSLIARYLGPLRSFIYASPGYLQQHGHPRDPGELARHRCLTMSDSPAFRQWQLVGKDGKERAVEVAPIGSANDLDALRMAVLGGAGLAVLPSYMCAADEASGRLVRVIPDWSPAPGDCHLVYPSRRGATPKMRAFVDFIVERVGRGTLRG